MSEASREVRERRFADAAAAYERGELTLTQARIVAGLASREVRLAFRFPRLLGHLSRLSAADRLRPVYAPEEGWALSSGDRASRPPVGPRVPPPPPPSSPPPPPPRLESERPPESFPPPPTRRSSTVDRAARGLREHWTWSAGSFLILLALAVAGGLLNWRIGPSQGAGSSQPAGSGSPLVAASPPVVGRLAVSSQLGFRCSLPVTAYSHRVRISLPSGSVTMDGAQGLDRNGPTSSAYRDGRWLPVPATWVSPDGRSYASVAPVPDRASEQRVLLIAVQDGKSRELWRGAGHAMIVGWTSEGLYFLFASSPAQQPGVASPADVWVVDPANPSRAHQVGPNSASRATASGPLAPFSPETKLGGGAAWDITHSPATNQDRVVRMDLRDGSLAVWYTGPVSTPVLILGLDGQGHPVLALHSSDRSSTKALALLTGANQVTQLSGSFGTTRFTSALADAHGVWLGSSGSLWLYSSGSLFKVADLPVGSLAGETRTPVDNGLAGSGSLPTATVVGPCS